MAFTAHASNLPFEDLPNEEAPSNAAVWTSKQYCVLAGWYSLTNADQIQLKPTVFVDKRLRFLDLVNDTKPPEEFAKAVSGLYDVKTWRKEDCVLSIDGETAIFMKFPMSPTTITYTSPNRLPTFPKSWKPVVFIVNQTTIAVRLTADITLIITRDDPNSSAFNVTAVDYNKGFICVHPCSETALAYGSYNLKGLKNCITVPPLCSSCGPWQYYLQFYPWGGLVTPKNLKATKAGGVAGLCGMGKCDKFGLVFHPPNLFLSLIFDIPAGTSRTLQHGTDFAVTAKKTSDSDIVIYLLIDGQLVTYDYSFDIRVNKPEKPRANVTLKFKVNIDKEEKQKALEKGLTPKWTFMDGKELKVPVKSGSPIGDMEYLISEQTVAVFDAETGQYLTHPQGAKKTSAFAKVLTNKPAQAAQTAQGAQPATAPLTSKASLRTAVSIPGGPMKVPPPPPPGAIAPVTGATTPPPPATPAAAPPAGGEK